MQLNLRGQELYQNHSSQSNSTQRICVIKTESYNRIIRFNIRFGYAV